MSLRPTASGPDSRPGIQSQSHLPRLSSLAMGESDRRTSSDQQREQTMADSSKEGRGVVQRCVIVPKDHLGFGFTVCGERVKLVQNVRPGGAADKAGVHEGDRIIKVNGSLVSSMTHQEVVKLIKSGTYAALTLQGPAPSASALPLQRPPRVPSPNQSSAPLPPQSSHTPFFRITGPKPRQDSEVQKQASQILRKMLEQEEAELQALQEELAFSPSPILEQRIQSAKRRAQQVKVKIQEDLDGTRFVESGANYMKAGEGGPSAASTEGDPEAQRPQIIGPEEDDDDFSPLNEMDGLFQDLDALKSQPALMTILIRYVLSQKLDPCPLLFFLCVEAYLGSAPKDACALAPQIFHHFLDPDAPLKIQMGEDCLCDIESRLQAQEDIRGPLSELQQLVLPVIQEQIQDYRSKRVLGLAALFGEGDLQRWHGDPMKERQVVDKQVTALWEILSKHEQERSVALASAVMLYLRHSGIKLQQSRLGVAAGRDRWLGFFPKAKKLSDAKRDGEDRRRNPILKYIKPNQPTHPGSVRNIIQQFESQQPDPAGEDIQGAVAQPELCTSGLEQSGERSVEPPVGLLLAYPALDEDSGEFQNWQEMVDPNTLVAVNPREAERQAVIDELCSTEASHLRTLRVLDQLFFLKLQPVLSTEQLACLFPNLPQVYSLHASLCDSMKKLKEGQGIGDIMLERFEGVAGAEFQEQVSLLCCRQSQALELIKNKQSKDPHFAQIIQECEASPHCRRLQLKDLLVSEMQRLTKYPLLLENIIKYSEALAPDLLPLQRALACCRGILQAVNEVVKETEHQQHLIQYQRQLDLTSLERQANPIAAQFKNLDLTTKKMIHEGSLTWRISKNKTIEVQALLLSDLLVLLQRAANERLVLRCPARGELNRPFSPVVRLDSLLVRSVATDNKAVYLISASEGQIYELAAATSSEKNIWKDLLEKSISVASASSDGFEPACASAFKSEIFQSDGSFSEGSGCVKTAAAEDEIQESIAATPADQVDQGQEGGGCVVAEAALQDVETLRRLIFRDLEEDRRSHDSDAPPTIDAANERALFIPRKRPGYAALSPSLREDEERAALPVKSGVEVVRTAEGVVNACDYISDDVSIHYNQSDSPKGGSSADGKTFSLALPEEQTQSDKTSTSHLFQEEHRDTPNPSPIGQTQDENERQSQSELVALSPLISSVEIFSTIEQLMDKLLQLREIEAAHHQLLLTLTDQPVNQVSSDSLQTTPTDARASIEQNVERMPAHLSQRSGPLDFECLMQGGD